ncbi:MAG: TIGR00366 family protein [Planctomycetota bacterium]
MKRFLGATDQFLQKYLPDPFVIAVGLTVFVFVCSVWYGASESTEYFAVAKRNIQFWGDGVWSLAAFTLHMAMILVGGYVIAISRPVNALLERLVAFVKTPLAAVIFCTLVSMLASWLNWGFGLVVGGIVALKVGKQVPEAPFRRC